MKKNSEVKIEVWRNRLNDALGRIRKARETHGHFSPQVRRAYVILQYVTAQYLNAVAEARVNRK